ncbi:MAG TPA: CBS domain-containing protein [Anaerolineales bacterium]
MTENSSSPQLVRDLMTVGVATCSPETPIVDIARILLDKGLDALVVLDQGEGHALGMVSQDDLARAYTRPDARQLKAEDVMSDGVPQVPPEIPLAAAAQIMRDQGVRALFIMHHAAGIEYPAAVISYRHLLRHLAAQDGEDLRDLGIQAARQSPLDVFIQRREEARRKAGGRK